MSKLSGLPDLPASVGGQSIPDFMNFEIVGDGKLPARHEVPDEFNFSIKKSPVFGQESGKKFDQGAVWYPLREVKFALSDKTGLGHYQGHYPGRSTAPVGHLPSTKTIGLKLNKDEHIVGFRAYSSDNVIEGVRVWTNDGSHKDFGKVQGATERGKDPEAFFLPADHEVVNFFGHTNEDGHIHGLGASYTRRLASLRARAPASGPSESPPRLSAFLSQTYLDASTQQSWATNDMATITRKRNEASKDLAPIYYNIHENGDKAWVHVCDPETGEEYYVSWDDVAIVWSYATDRPSASGSGDTKNSVISIGSYSSTQNMLSVSGYIWENIPAATIPSVTALAFATLAKSLISQGIEWGIQYAASKLAEFLTAVGAKDLAALIPTSVESTGGLVIAGVIGVFVVFGLLALLSVIFKKFWLVLNVYNFDLDYQWSSAKHYGDNAQPSNGEWQDRTIPTFKPADPAVFPPGFNPRQPMESTVTALSMTFDNVKVGMQGLGEGVLMNRDDSQAGIALKYIVRFWTDNEVGLKFIDGDASAFDLEDYYNNGNWVKSQSVQVDSGEYSVTGYTPELSGSDNNNYYFDVSIRLPPPVVR
ncbi:putative transmembrane protein [Rhizoctonia solani 123E]|uniref:Putative transmembrane protein n=1 Tax=Rhizoctonia solani 123E TaxID=1423351 RepID=A0A074RP64_9AGAM|nr:putative transmembrane protein [Rhizoctonia solani 123E]